MTTSIIKHCVTAIVLFSAQSLESYADEQRPNVALFLVDDLGWRDLGCYGSTFYATPNIDRFVAHTRIDRFILLSTLMVFGSMLQTVAGTVLINRKKKALDEQINRWTRVVYPAIFVLVLFISFVA